MLTYVACHPECCRLKPSASTHTRVSLPADRGKGAVVKAVTYTAVGNGERRQRAAGEGLVQREAGKVRYGLPGGTNLGCRQKGAEMCP